MGEEKAPSAEGAISESSVGYLENSEVKPPRQNTQIKFQDRNPRAVREAKRLLKLEFLHECAGGIQIHAALVQTFAEIGDTAGVAMRCDACLPTPRRRIPFLSSFAKRAANERGRTFPAQGADASPRVAGATAPAPLRNAHCRFFGAPAYRPEPRLSSHRERC
jgi:hypothetical protein